MVSLNTLPDYLVHGLDIVFVGLNPGLTSVEAGHYFASPRNRFWPALNRSGLLAQAAEAANDHELLAQGIGFTDVVKRPSAGASDLRATDFKQWAPVLHDKLSRFQPMVACFHGVTAYKGYLRYACGSRDAVQPGLQAACIGRSKVFVVPNPSPANAAVSLDELVEWYRRLKGLLDGLKGAGVAP